MNDPLSSSRPTSQSPTVSGEIKQAQQRSPATPAEIVRMEANFLQFPFFALDTHDLRTRAGMTCTATRFIGNERHEVTVRISRNSDCSFPGPLSRRIHFALLSKMQQEQGFPPFRNPIKWSWYDLAKRLGLKSCSGRSIQQMKEAIEATHGALIRTRYSLQHSEQQTNPLRKQISAWHLYERYVFIDDTLPNGEIADTNHLWLSDWYLANLNSQYCGPINYELWQFLNNESRIASRLYEYLTWNFSKRIPVFRIGYEKLAQFLPVKPLQHLSQIRQQLEPALGCLKRQRLIESFSWERGSTNQIMLAITPAMRLISTESSSISEKTTATPTDCPAKPAAKPNNDAVRKLIAEFYHRWADVSDARPRPKETALAEEVIRQYGTEQTQRLLPLVLNLMKQSFPDAQSFGATRNYWPLACQNQKKSAERHHADQQKQQQEQTSETVRKQDRQKKVELRRQWAELSESEQKRIDQLVYESADDFVRRKMDAGQFEDRLVELARLQTLEKEQAERTS